MAKNLGGRPLHGNAPKRAAISIKVQQELRDFLEAEAERNKRSFTQEIEVRLEASRGQDFAPLTESITRFLWLLNAILGDVQKITGNYWYETREAILMSQGAIAHLIRAFSTVGEMPAMRDLLKAAKTDKSGDQILYSYMKQSAEIADIGAALAQELIEKLAPSLANSPPLGPHALIPRGV